MVRLTWDGWGVCIAIYLVTNRFLTRENSHSFRGWGSAWRNHREFVGQLEYGIVYKLWQPERHASFGRNFQDAAHTILACQRRDESPVARLPDECIFYILNMCRWDWFEDDVQEMSQRRLGLGLGRAGLIWPSSRRNSSSSRRKSSQRNRTNGSHNNNNNNPHDRPRFRFGLTVVRNLLTAAPSS